MSAFRNDIRMSKVKTFLWLMKKEEKYENLSHKFSFRPDVLCKKRVHKSRLTFITTTYPRVVLQTVNFKAFTVIIKWTKNSRLHDSKCDSSNRELAEEVFFSF